jgi:hypothetical protein
VLLILFGAMLNFGINWLNERRLAIKTKKRLYRNAWKEAVDNLTLANYLLSNYGSMGEEFLFERNPPVFSAEAFVALENCYFLTDKEQEKVSELNAISLELKDYNEVLRNYWKLGYGQKVGNVLQKAQQEIADFGKEFRKIGKACSFTK